MRLDLRAVIYRHQRWWIAHCLELDLVAEGPTPASAFQDLRELSTSQIEAAKKMGNLESIFRAAPPEIWAMFFRARRASLPVKRKQTSGSVESFEAREAILA
ncbi:MAG: hypothetical protein ACLQLG_04500 [Thermoguttaceae bacterium]